MLFFIWRCRIMAIVTWFINYLLNIFGYFNFHRPIVCINIWSLNKKNKFVVSMTTMKKERFFMKTVILVLRTSKLHIFNNYQSFNLLFFPTSQWFKKSQKKEIEIRSLFFCGNYWIRTSDPLLVRQMLWTSWAKLP